MNAKRALWDPLPRQHHRLVIWLGVLTLILSLMSPLIAIQTADAQENLQGETQECPPGQILDEATGTCIDDPAQDQDLQQQDQPELQCPQGQIPDETGTVCIPDPNQPPPVEPTFVQIDKYDCPTGTDWSTVTDLTLLSQGCAPNQMTVTMTVNGEMAQITASGEWGPYQEVTSHNISEEIPQGYNFPHIFCGAYVPNVSTPQMNYFGAAAQVAPTVNPGESVYCQIFNHQIPTGGTVTVYKWDCAPGTQYSQPLEYYQGGLPDQETGPCETEHLNIPISLIDGSGQRDTTTQANGTQWDDVVLQNGSFQITVDEPAGYGDPMVFCGTLDQDMPSAVSATGGTVTLTPTTTPFDYQCNWYNIPEPPYAQILIEKYWCNEGYMPAEDASQSDIMGSGECQAQGPQTTFSLEGPGGPYDDMMVPGNPGDVVTWPLTQGGTYTVTEQVPDGYQMVVYCHTSPLQVNGSGQVDPQRWEVMNGNQIQWEAQGGFYWICAIFNVQTEPNSVTVYKWDCVEGTEYGQSQAYYQGEGQDQGPCETEHLNIPIRLIDGHPDSPRETTTQANGTEWDDVVLQNGSFQVQIDEPTGYGDPMVFCGALDDEQQTAVPAPGGMFTITPASEPFTYQCNVYDMMAGENSVTVYKWECVEGTESGQTQAYYQGEGQDQAPCESEHLNIPISLIHGGPQQDTTTQANGTEFDGVILDQNGSFSIFIDEPDGFGDPMVFCGTLDDEQQTPYPAPGGTWTITPAGEPFTYQCNVYDIPYEGNSVTVYKWQCEPGTMYDQPHEYYQGQNGDPGPCETQHTGVPMTLVDGSGNRPMQTQADGTTWNDVTIAQEGELQLIETIPPGYGDPMVFCWTNDGDPMPMQATNGLVVLQPQGEEPWSYYCDWYNIPYEGEYQLDLVKFTCTADVDRTLGLPDLGTNPNCAPDEGVSFTATFGMTPGSARYTDANGQLSWLDVPGGPWSLTEEPMTGYQPPKVFCGPPETTEAPEVPVMDWTVTGTLDSTNPHIICTWFNFEQPLENGRITVIKYQCPPGTESTDFGLLQETCTTPHNGIGFTLTGNGVDSSAATSGGSVGWLDLDQGTYTVTEDLWPGYNAPLVWCGYVVQDGADIDPGSQEFTSYAVTDTSIQVELSNFPAHLVCYWYNFPTDPGEITIHKWTCPPGYDIDAWGADPKTDCTLATNGVTFTLDQPMGTDLQTDTGDSIDGAVYFGGLDPGAYSVTETVPAGTAYVFVLDCTGMDIPKVHQVPLSWGNKLDINVSSGDQIVCHWYNVPRPETGWVTVHKYVCSTTTFVDKVYCVIYEQGRAFELFRVDGNASMGTGITGAGGTYTWSDLEPGAYSIREEGGVPCKMTATSVDGKGNAWVNAGEGTVIKVYNCTTTPGKVPPGKIPTKYPNTGVPPEADLVAPSLQDAPEGTATPGTSEEAEEFYQVDCLSGDVAATPPASTPTPETEATMPPIEPEPTETPPPAESEGTPTPPATPEVGEGECERGAIPQHLEIESVGIDADFEYLEIVDGLMQQPSGPELVAWYKDTARLGETNNVVVAGHLNWWNVPEGVFYRLQDLQEGDRVEVTGDDGRIYVYEVQSVRQESDLEPPGVDVIGPTDEPTLTLITCGGEWNADIAEYEERTVTRAVQVDVIEPEASAGDEAAFSPQLEAQAA